MEGFDPKVERQVWQRVLGNAEQPRGDLRALLLAAMEAAAVYRKLAGGASGRNREKLRRLYDGQMETAACLRGIGRLSGAGDARAVNISTPAEPIGKALEKRYHCTRRALTEYTARTVDGEFGAVFQRLADIQREQCVLLAELLGGPEPESSGRPG